MEPERIKIDFSNGDRPVFVHVNDASAMLDMDVDIVYSGSVTFGLNDPGIGDATGIMRQAAMSAALTALVKERNFNLKDPASHRAGLAEAIRQDLAEQYERRGFRIFEVEISHLDLTDSDRARIDMMYKMAEMRDPKVAAQRMMEQQQKVQELNIKEAKEAAALGPSKWKCHKCGTINTSKFCMECGTKREWTCSCGTVNLGRYCTECGKGRALVELDQSLSIDKILERERRK